MGLGSHVMHGVSDQGMPLTVKETQEQAHDQGPIVPHTSRPEAASLAECESGLLQAQLKCHVGGSALGGGVHPAGLPLWPCLTIRLRGLGGRGLLIPLGSTQ